MKDFTVKPILTAEIRYYAFMQLVNNGNKTPKYEINQSVGDYAPMNKLRGKNGKISMYLMHKISNKENAPEYYLQAKDSLNFTGLKNYFIKNKPSAFAYGYPNSNRTYSKDNKINPFFEYKKDAFLFIMQFDAVASTPKNIELIVLKGGGCLIELHLKALIDGGYNGILQEYRKQAQKNANLYFN